MQRFHRIALLLALALGIVTEWLCSPILDSDNQSNIFLGLKRIDYPEAYCLWFHSWPERLLGNLANPSPNFGNLSYSPAFYVVVTLQWTLLFYLLILIVRFFYCQNNPRILKVAFVVTLALLLATLHYKLHSDVSEHPRMKHDIQMCAENVGRMRAEKDFSAGILRKFVFSGSKSVEKYTGTNSGPFEMWTPNFVAEPYEISQFAAEWEFYGYNTMMQKKYRAALRQTTNSPVSSTVE